MSTDRVALDHLLNGRAALVSQIERLTVAVGQLDGVIDRLRAEQPAGPVESGSSQPNRPGQPNRTDRQPVTSLRSRTASNGQNGKSIRTRVLEMLATEERDFSLTEIIERIRAVGIQAHDDAIRSITVKLMRDGHVERVGRGRYRLTRVAENNGVDDIDLDEDRFETDPTVEPVIEPTIEPERYTPPLNLTEPWTGTGAGSTTGG